MSSDQEFKKRHPVYTQHKLSLKQLDVLRSIDQNNRTEPYGKTLEKLETCELVYRVNRWPNKPQAVDYWEYHISQAGLDALLTAELEGWQE